MFPVGLRYLGYHNEDPPYEFTSAAFTRFFDYASPHNFWLGDSIPSTTFAWIARFISQALYDYFDVAVLGRLYLAMLLTISLIFYIYSSCSSRTMVIALLICVISSESLPVFNSFFSDPSAMIALFTAVAVFFTDIADKKKRVIHYGAGFILSLAKSQFVASLFVFWLCGLLLKNVSIRERIAGLILAVIPFLILANFPLSRDATKESGDLTLDSYFVPNRYVAIFNGILLVPPADALRIMNRLNLPETYSILIGTSYFTLPAQGKSLIEYDSRIWTSISKLTLLRIYLTEPIILMSLAPYFFENLRDNRPYLPNFTYDELRKHPQKRFYQPPQPSISSLRSLLVHHYLAGLFLLTLYLCLSFNHVEYLELNPSRYGIVAIINIIVFIGSQIVIVALFAGVEDLNRHLLITRLALELLIGIVVVQLIRSLIRYIVSHD